MSNKRYTDEQLDFIKSMQHISRADQAKKLFDRYGIKITAQGLSSLCARYGIKSTYECINGVEHRFKKGMKPWNTGKKGVNGRSSTVFKKGNMPKTWVPPGSISVGKGGYLKVKLGEKKWEYIHKITWEHFHGKVPEGYIITFLDGDIFNFNIDNLAMISRRTNVNMARSGAHTLPAEQKTVMINAILLDQKIKDIKDIKENKK